MLIVSGKYQANKKKKIDKLNEKLSETNDQLFQLIKVDDKVKPKNLFNAIDLYKNDSLMELMDKKEKFKHSLVILENYLEKNIEMEKIAKQKTKNIMNEIKMVKKRIKELDSDIEKIKSYFSFE